MVLGVFDTVRQKYGRLDIVVNNAGISGENKDNWETMVDINLVGIH